MLAGEYRKGCHMGVFKRKQKIVSIQEIFVAALNMSNSLRKHYQKGRNDDFEERCRVFDESGIREYTQHTCYTNSSEVIPGSMKIAVKETFGKITRIAFASEQPIVTEDRNIVHVTVFSATEKKSNTAYSVVVEMSAKKWRSKYGSLKMGDAFELDGPAYLSYTHDPRALVDASNGEPFVSVILHVFM